MENEKQKIIELYWRWMEKTASPQEVEELFQLSENDNWETISQLMGEQWSKENGAFEYSILRQKEVVGQILTQYPANKKVVVLNTSFLYRCVAACVILFIVGAGYYWINGRKENSKTTAKNTLSLPPGKSGAILTLADGTKVLLDTVKNATVAQQGGVTAKVTNGVLAYEGAGSTSELAYNTMATPNGRVYKMTLPDGTQVWLNAASSIRYPTMFSGKERMVEVTGEAYFDVAKNMRMPFVVHVNGKATIQVLGTEFNVNAYDNEKSIKATLVNGSVKVLAAISEAEKENGQNKNDKESVILSPKQQAQIANDVMALQQNKHRIEVRNGADIEKVVAWKNGIFNFDGVGLEEAMKQLERWYDIKVVYNNGVPDIVLTGEMTKGVTLNDLIEGLSTLGLKLKLDGRTLTVLN